MLKSHAAIGYKSIFETFKTRLELLDSKLQVILYIKS